MPKIGKFIILVTGIFIGIVIFATQTPSSPLPQIANAQYPTATPACINHCPNAVCDCGENQYNCPMDCGGAPPSYQGPCGSGGTCPDGHHYDVYCSPACGTGTCYSTWPCDIYNCNRTSPPGQCPPANCGVPINPSCAKAVCATGGNCYSDCSTCLYGPTPTPGGSGHCDSGCGSCGYRNPDNSCSSQGFCCPPTLPPGATSTPGPTPTPPTVNCNDSAVTLSVVPDPSRLFQPITFGIVGDAGNSARDFRGGFDLSSCNGTWNNTTCSTNQPGIFTWTHQWVYCIGTQCSSLCSKSINYTVNGYSISGTVWVDPNNDGVRSINGLQADADDYPLPVPFTITNDQFKPVTYLGNGKYTYDSLVPGFTYATSLQSLYPGYVITYPPPAPPLTGSSVRTDTPGAPGDVTNADFWVTPLYSLVGHVYEDKNYNNCTDKIPYQSGGLGTNLTLFLNGSAISGPTDSDGAGGVTYTNLMHGNYSLTTTIPLSYSVYSTQADKTKRSNTYLFPLAAAGDPGWNALTNTETVTFCLTNVHPWSQVSQGDVRMPKIVDKIIPGQFVSSDPLNPATLFSTTFTHDFGTGNASPLGAAYWTSDNEYSYNNLSVKEKGGLSYDFYKARALQTGTAITPVTSGFNNLDLSNWGGVYEIYDPVNAVVNAVITNYFHHNGAHLIVLVRGNVTIKTPIHVPAGSGNIFILAAQGSIDVDPSVGVDVLAPTHALDTASTNATDIAAVTDIDGIYSAEGGFTVDTIDSGCLNGISDKKLNIGGMVVANSAYSFSEAGGGEYKNQRSLCSYDRDYPSVKIFSRYDFIGDMTDFYKENVFTWKEVAP